MTTLALSQTTLTPARMPPGLSFCWLLWRRSRWGFYAIGGYFILSFILMTFFSGLKKNDDAVMLMVPCTAAFIFILTTFGYGDADLGARESGFPRHPMTLPAPTYALVLYPMLFGAGAMLTLWLLLWTIILHPGGLPAPMLWPGVMFAALLSCMQAAVIWPFGIRFIRVPLLLIIGGSFITLLSVAVHLGASETNLTLGCLAVCAACFAAVEGLRRARRGDGTYWPWLANLLASFERRGRRKQPFASGQAAQLWIERSRNGLLIPFQLAFACGAMTIVVFILRANQTPRSFMLGQDLVQLDMLTVLSSFAALGPVLMSSFMGSSLGKRDTWTKDLAVGSFLGVRPISSLEIVACKMRLAAWIATVSWAIVLASITLWCLILPTSAQAMLAKLVGSPVSTSRVIGLVILLLLLIAFTWRMLVTAMWITLFGRKWLSAAFPITMLVLWSLISPLSLWVYHHPEKREAASDWFAFWLPWIMAGMLAAKAWTSIAIARRLIDRKLVEKDRAKLWFETWLAIGGLLCVPIWWILPAAGAKGIPLLLGCMLMVPFTRLAGAVLLLDMNRHR